MAEEISGDSRVVLNVSSTDTEGVASQTASIAISQSGSYANGTSNGQVDTGYSADGTLGAGGTLTIDLDGGSLTGPLGDAQTFADVQAVYVENNGSGDLTISGDFLGLTTDSLSVPAGGYHFLGFGTAGKAVVASTADQIVLTSTAGTDYKLVVVGRSA